MPTTEGVLTDEQKRHRRFCLAVENFIDLYKFIMVLAIGNCVRCLAERQIQPNLANANGLELNLNSVSLQDGFMFVLVMIFVARFFLGDLSYWKLYTERNTKIQVTDALNLLLNSFFLTYMSFFIGYTHLVSYMMFFLLAAEVIWGGLRWVEGRFRKSDGPLPREINLGILLSSLTIFVMACLVLAGRLPDHLPDGRPLSDAENWILIAVLGLNTVFDLIINGGRYLGAPGRWRLTIQRNIG